MRGKLFLAGRKARKIENLNLTLNIVRNEEEKLRGVARGKQVQAEEYKARLASSSSSSSPKSSSSSS